MARLIQYFGCLILAVYILCTPDYLSAQFSNFSGKIVFTRGIKQKNISHIFLSDGSSLKTKQLTRSGRNGWPEWAPDGKQIIFASFGRTHKNREIYLMASDGESQVRLTDTEKGNSSDPRWSEDGQRIYFVSGIKGVVQENIIDLELCRIDGITGTKATPRLVGCEKKYLKDEEKVRAIEKYENKLKALRELAGRESGLFEIFPSPDGRYAILHFNKTGEIELYDVIRKAIKELKVKYSGWPAWARDSKRFACSPGYTPEQALIIYDIEKDQSEEIKLGMGPDIACGGKMSWSQDSKQIVYSCGTPFSEQDDSWLYILDLQTKKSIKLIQGNSPDWY